jgi:hypothetical protein
MAALVADGLVSRDRADIVTIFHHKLPQKLFHSFVIHCCDGSRYSIVISGRAAGTRSVPKTGIPLFPTCPTETTFASPLSSCGKQRFHGSWFTSLATSRIQHALLLLHLFIASLSCINKSSSFSGVKTVACVQPQ